MKVNHIRQRVLSFKVTQVLHDALTEIRLRMSNKEKRVITKTDVIEEAIRVLAKREKVNCE